MKKNLTPDVFQKSSLTIHQYEQAKKNSNLTYEQAKASSKEYQNQAVTQYEQAKAEAQAQLETARARGGEYQKQAEGYLRDAENRLEAARKQYSAKMMQAVDKFDETVEVKAAEAKSGIMSWFGGSK